MAILANAPLPAGGAKSIFQKLDKLAESDPKDRILRTSPAKTYHLNMNKETGYRIDMVSDAVDSYLRLENEDGDQLASDNNSGGSRNARIVFQPKETGVYRVIATCSKPTSKYSQVGEFTLTVSPASTVEILEMRARNIHLASPAERNATLAQVKGHLKELGRDLSQRDVEIALAVGAALEPKTPKLAVAAYLDFAKVLAGATAPRIIKVGLTFEGHARRLELPGKHMDLKGNTIEGKALDLAQLPGKIVLIDFWATWSLPSLEDLPHLRRLHDAYSDRGFEILAVSLDQDQADLAKFLKARKLPWPCIHDGRTDGKSLAAYYGVSSLPCGFLVNRDGKVISLNARGRELERLLEEHIGPLAP